MKKKKKKKRRKKKRKKRCSLPRQEDDKNWWPTVIYSSTPNRYHYAPLSGTVVTQPSQTNLFSSISRSNGQIHWMFFGR